MLAIAVDGPAKIQSTNRDFYEQEADARVKDGDLFSQRFLFFETRKVLPRTANEVFEAYFEVIIPILPIAVEKGVIWLTSCIQEFDLGLR